MPTVKMIHSRLKEDKIGPQVGKETLRRFLHTLGYSFKKVDTRVQLLEKPHLKEWRKKFLQRLNENESSEYPKDVIYLDESWIDCNATATKGWVPRISKSKRDRIDHSTNKKPGKGARLIMIHAGKC